MLHNLFRAQGSLIRAFFGLLLGAMVSVMVTPAGAAMSPNEMTLACNSLARMAFDLKDLVGVVALRRNPGPFQVFLAWGSVTSFLRHGPDPDFPGYPRRVQ